MARVNVDFTGVNSFTVIPKGVYQAKCTKVTMVKAKSSGNNMIRAQFEIMNGRYAGNLVLNDFVLVEKAKWRLYAFMQAIGLPVKQGKTAVDTDKFLNKVVMLDVITSDYNGKTTNKVANFAPVVVDEDDEGYDEEDYEEEDDDPRPSTKANRVTAYDDEDEEEEAPKPKRGRPAGSKNTAAKKAKTPDPDPEDEEEEDEVAEEAPKQKKPAAKPKAKPAAAKKAAPPPVEEDEADEEDEDEDDGEFEFLEDDD